MTGRLKIHDSMNDNQLLQFEMWYRLKEPVWKEYGILIERTYRSSYAIQRHLDLCSEYALAHIGLYKSNDFYWVDFEALSLLDRKDFYRVNITFNGCESIEKTANEFEDYMRGL